MTDDTLDQGNPLETLVGPGKKFSTVEELAKGKLEADAFIEQLKSEKQQVLDELAKHDKTDKDQHTIADLIKEFRKPDSESEGQPAITDEELQEKIKAIMLGEETSRTRELNRDKGNTLVLAKVNGNAEAAKTFIAEKAKELGITPSDLTNLSETSPIAFAKVIGVDQSTSQQGTANLKGVNTQFESGAARLEIDGHKTKAWYDQQKSTLGVARYIGNNKLQLQYLKDAQALGERFSN